RMRFEIGDETFDLEPGDSWMIPSGVPHEAAGIERCRVVEAFSPPREDWREGQQTWKPTNQQTELARRYTAGGGLLNISAWSAPPHSIAPFPPLRCTRCD